MFISYTKNVDGAHGKGFSASFTFGKKVNILTFLILWHETNFDLSTDNLCNNALDLANGILNIKDNWPLGTYCQWLILAQDNDGYVTLEFQNFNVRNTLASKMIKYFIM